MTADLTPWVDVLAADPTRLDHCLVGHDAHVTRLVPCDRGRMHVFAWEFYADAGNYCTGDDEVSKAIDVNGGWERNETAVIGDLFARTTPGVVLDLGAHVGWYSVFAAQHGHQVLAFDGSAEHLRALTANVKLSHCADRLTPVLGWLDDTTKALDVLPDVDVSFVKVDVEGKDSEAVRVIAPLLEARAIGAVLVEVSPVFGSDWRVAFDGLTGWGYHPWLVPDGNVDSPAAETRARPVAAGAMDEWPQRSVLFTREWEW